MKKAGIYIHVPFCKIKCMYCDFYSITKRKNDMPIFIDMLIKEIKNTAKSFNHDWVFNTIFFGGGTPSLLKSHWITRILDTLNSCFNLDMEKEITLETNPGEVSLKDLMSFKKSGINRISLGCQSLQPELLKFLSRIHSPEDSVNTFKNARKAGFENINMDLIFNIPGQTIDQWKNDLKQIVKLQPNHISAYSLTVEPNTILYNQIHKGNISMPSENVDLQMFEYAQNYLNKNNYKQYEISNYAINGKECKHNLHYWNLNPYLAFGPSAHGYDGKIRWWNVSSLDKYMEKIKDGKSPISGQETLNNNEHFNEIIFNGIRTINGIQLNKLNSLSISSNILNTSIKKWTNELKVTNKFITLKKEAYKFADEIASDMMV